MTAAEIASFVHRLLHRELAKEELAALTTQDLATINAYLAEYAKAYSSSIYAAATPASAHHGRRRFRDSQPRTYTEEEILAELGVLES